MSQRLLDFGIEFTGDFPESRPEPPHRTIQLSKIADQGFTHIWFNDTHALNREVFINMTLCALNTRKAKLGTGVTSPHIRPLIMSANGIATIDEISDGRAIFGLGGGFNLINELGARMSTVQEISNYVGIMRKLLNGERVSYEDRAVSLCNARLRFASKRKIPILLAASGPKLLRMAGAVADGAIMSLGPSTNVLKAAISELNAGAVQASRNPDELYKVSWNALSISENRNDAIKEAKAYVAQILSPQHSDRIPDWADIPRHDALKVRHAYDETKHLDSTATAISLVTDEMVDKLCIAGTLEDCRRKVATLEGSGVNQVSFLTMSRSEDKPNLVENIVRNVIPSFR